MSRHAAATSAGRSRTPQRTAPAVPRRVSGPVAPNRRDGGGSRGERAPGGERDPSAERGRGERAQRVPRARIDASALAYADAAIAAPRPFTARRTVIAPRPQRLAYGGVAIASRVAGVALDVSASRLMDRLVRGRVWIGVVAFCLIGLVATQVSLLKLNSGIGRAVQTASTLERSNASLRAEISRLSAGDRIQRLAAANGMVMPAPADVTYLRGRGDAARAAQRMHAPDPNVPPGLAGAAIQTATPVTPAAPGVAPATGQAQAPPASATTAPTGAAPAVTPATTAPATTAPATTAPATTAPVTTAPVTTAPAATPAATAAAGPAVSQPAATGAAAPAGAPSGGAAPQATTATP